MHVHVDCIQKCPCRPLKFSSAKFFCCYKYLCYKCAQDMKMHAANPLHAGTCPNNISNTGDMSRRTLLMQLRTF